MTLAERELIVSRIMAGSLLCTVYTEEGCRLSLFVKRPTTEQIYLGQELYMDYKQELEWAGCPTESEINDWMLKAKLWSQEKETELKAHEKNLEDFKVNLYEAAFKSSARVKIKKLIKSAREMYSELMQQKSMFFYLSCSGAASILRSKYLLAMSLYYMDGKPFYNNAEEYWQSHSNYILEQIIEYYQQNRLTESTYRELARTEPWRPIWNCKRSEGKVFGLAPVDMNEEQRNLSIWSNLYDNVYEHSESPADIVIENDDMLDGWMILQRRKRAQEMDKKYAEDFAVSDKIKEATEVLIPAETLEDAQRIYNMNDDHARRVIRQRENFIRKHGKVPEGALPDNMMQIQQELTKMYIEKGKSSG